MKRPPNVPLPLPYLDRTTVARLIEGNWWMRAACQSSDPDLFFPVSSTGKSLEQVDEAKAVCARCLVRRQCLVFALQTRQVHGIWGGLTEEERNQTATRQPGTARRTAT
ncbi:MAG: WhiB family transcriptional regulator [Streptosporangiaceae bacterium]